MYIRKVNFIKTMRLVLFMALAISIIWNIFCLSGVLPLKLYTVTYSFVYIPFAAISFRSLLFQTRGISSYIGDLNRGEKIQGSIVACLIVIWVTTTIICLVH